MVLGNFLAKDLELINNLGFLNDKKQKFLFVNHPQTVGHYIQLG